MWLGLAAPAAAQQPSDAPYFLVATREMPDPTFKHTVILMLPHGDSPIVVGLIINRPTTVPVKELFSNAPALRKQAEIAYFGGPVSPDEAWLAMRTSVPPAKSIQVFADLCLLSDPRAVSDSIKASTADGDLRLYLGRAQWTPDQLQGEINEGSWYVEPAQPELVFSSDPNRIWPTLVDRGGIVASR